MEWRLSSPNKQGMNAGKLGDLQNQVGERFPLATSILIVRHGYIVLEEYYNGDQTTARVIWSVTKSILSALVGIAFTKATGLRAADFGKKHLFGPLGITSAEWASSRASGVTYSEGGLGLQLTARDMAKIGYLYLKRGMWDGKQVVPSEWVEASTHDQIHKLESRGDFLVYAMDYFDGYGYLWRVRANADHASFAAVGMGGQFIHVTPDLDLVVVITTLDSDSETPTYLSIISDYVLPAVTH